MSENYKDIDDNSISLERLVKSDPDWACSRIRWSRRRIAELEAEIVQLRDEQSDVYDFDMVSMERDKLRGVVKQVCEMTHKALGERE